MVMQIAITLFALFFFFRDRREIMNGLRSLVPLSNREATEVFRRIRGMIRASILGTVVVAFVQGSLGGLMFWFLGLPAPVLWALVMSVLAMIPTLGAPVVWVPAAAFLAAQGSWGKAIILVAWGMLAVGLIDNLLYPMLVGKEMQLHTLVVFLAVIGGLFLLGASGIVLGPVVLAITLALIDILRRRTARGRDAEEPT
jgi:predicted PurR-regulated permease PerM